jgi:two-component system LytT family sensor kinase
MSSVLPHSSAAAGGAPGRGWFSGFGKRHLAIVLVYCTVVPLTGAVMKVAVDPALDVASVLGDVVSCFIVGVAAMLTIIAAESRLAGVLGPTPRMAIAVAVSALAGTVLMEAVTQLLVRPLGLRFEEADAVYSGELHRLAFHFAGAATWSLMLIVLYTMFEARRRATEALHAVRVSALAAERAMVEGDLRAMQARVDPDLLFDTLLAVGEAYERSVSAGEQALDALIGFLRAALPAEASATSSVGRELEHVRAYLAVIELRSAAKLHLDLRAEPPVREAPMPAMLMLPLVRWALDGRPANRLQVTARRQEGALVISVQSDVGGTSAPAGGDLAGMRDRLMHLYQGRGRLEAAVGEHERRASMEIPL